MTTIKRQVFYSFHYKNDNWRVSQIKNFGSVEGQTILSSNEWGEVKKKSDTAIAKWIDDSMKYRSCLIVLIGEKTANRKWIKYEIKKAYEDKKGLLGIYIHNLKDKDGNQSNKGDNPFDIVVDGVNLTTKSKTYNSSFTTSQDVYVDISEKIKQLVEDAILLNK